MYHVFDVGGMRSERKKWIHCKDKVGAVLFTVDIGSWDQLLLEDETSNRMQEALMLFDSIVNSGEFVMSKFALIFTKYDKLAAKLESRPLKSYFPDFERNNNIEEATAYITNRFVSLIRNENKSIEVYYTSIVDEQQSLGKTAVEALQRVAQDTYTDTKAAKGADLTG